jgi:hypothetical protein
MRCASKAPRYPKAWYFVAAKGGDSPPTLEYTILNLSVCTLVLKNKKYENQNTKVSVLLTEKTRICREWS